MSETYVCLLHQSASPLKLIPGEVWELDIFRETWGEGNMLRLPKWGNLYRVECNPEMIREDASTFRVKLMVDVECECTFLAAGTVNMGGDNWIPLLKDAV